MLAAPCRPGLFAILLGRAAFVLFGKLVKSLAGLLISAVSRKAAATLGLDGHVGWIVGQDWLLAFRTLISAIVFRAFARPTAATSSARYHETQLTERM